MQIQVDKVNAKTHEPRAREQDVSLDDEVATICGPIHLTLKNVHPLGECVFAFVLAIPKGLWSARGHRPEDIYSPASTRKHVQSIRQV